MEAWSAADFEIIGVLYYEDVKNILAHLYEYSALVSYQLQKGKGRASFSSGTKSERISTSPQMPISSQPMEYKHSTPKHDTTEVQFELPPAKEKQSHDIQADTGEEVDSNISRHEHVPSFEEHGFQEARKHVSEELFAPHSNITSPSPYNDLPAYMSESRHLTELFNDPQSMGPAWTKKDSLPHTGRHSGIPPDEPSDQNNNDYSIPRDLDQDR